MEGTESANRQQLPYRAEYAPTSRAKCKKCDSSIEKDSLKMSYMVKSRFHDGMDAKSHHLECFFQIKRPKTVADIAHFEKLKYEDQKLLEKAIETNGASVLGEGAGDVDDDTKGKKKSAKGSKRKLEGASSGGVTYGDFKVEPAKSSRSECQLCEEKIEKGVLRICKLDYEASDSNFWSNGPVPRWFHVGCFSNGRASLDFANGVVEKIPGFSDLEEDEQKQLKKAIKPIKVDKSVENESAKSNKKVKQESNGKVDKKEAEDNAQKLKEEKLLRKQSDKYFALKEVVSKMKKADIVEMLQAMNQKSNFTKTSSLVDHAADILQFGPLSNCKKCKGQFILRGSAYICTGGSEWASCDEETRDPPRGPPNVPDEIVEKYPYFETTYKFKPGKRIFPSNFVRAIEEKDSEINPKLDALAPLEGLIIGVSQWKTLKPERAKIESKVKSLGGTIQTSIDKSLFVLMASKQEIEKEQVKVETAIAAKIPIVSPDFLFKVKKPEDVPKYLKECLLSDWEGEFEQRYAKMNVKQIKEKIKTKSSASNTKLYKSGSVAKSQTLVIKDGNAVDPLSGLQHTGRIYKKGSSIFSVVLNCVDVEKDKNSFYKMQIIEHEGKKKLFTLFRSWGRIGCEVGGDTQADYKDSEDAVAEFEKLYKERTNNSWNERDRFVKKHGFYFPIELDYGSNENNSKQEEPLYSSKSSLSKEIQELISFIFDINRMRRAMLEFELDTTKMPLGKLSKVHILEAMSVLKELEAAISPKDDVKPKKKDIVALTNKLYSHIPHSFGDGKVKLISSLKEIEEKNEMLAALAEIEIAYDMCSHIENEGEVLPVDQYYIKLDSEMSVLPKESSEFAMITEYARLSHAITHNNYKLNIQEIICVSRREDIARFEEFKSLDRSLIWHGSRTTNYAGILSQGLRIAPPEAPVTGYMFGKGIYFADMVSKAANYCMANPENNTGLVLLCEVALGKMHKVTTSVPEFPKGIPEDCNSVMGVGKTVADPSTYKTIEKGLVVPMGKGIPNKGVKSQLLYNEFVIYNEAQAKIRYILKTEFEFVR